MLGLRVVPGDFFIDIPIHLLFTEVKYLVYFLSEYLGREVVFAKFYVPSSIVKVVFAQKPPATISLVNQNCQGKAFQVFSSMKPVLFFRRLGRVAHLVQKPPLLREAPFPQHNGWNEKRVVNAVVPWPYEVYLARQFLMQTPEYEAAKRSGKPIIITNRYTEFLMSLMGKETQERKFIVRRDSDGHLVLWKIQRCDYVESFGHAVENAVTEEREDGEGSYYMVSEGMLDTFCVFVVGEVDCSLRDGTVAEIKSRREHHNNHHEDDVWTTKRFIQSACVGIRQIIHFTADEDRNIVESNREYLPYPIERGNEMSLPVGLNEAMLLFSHWLHRFNDTVTGREDVLFSTRSTSPEFFGKLNI